ncbi:MAG: O-antigen ligase domain-containing protein [Rhodocyclaceae bacterium]|nr:MAG: O-antigen ligase domain-containing protein [Rhodocyclaceae bacterium]
MTFLYAFMNFFQPGVFWPQMADLKPMLVLSLVGVFVGLARKSAYSRKEAFSHPIFFWLATFIVVQAVSLVRNGLSVAMAGFSFWDVYLFFVIVSLLLITDEKTLSRYVWGMMVGGMFITAFGILAVIDTWPQAVGGRAGAYGMYENHNDYSFLIIQIVPFLYMYRKISQRTSVRLLLGLSLLACMVGIMMSLSRGGMMALVLEFALIILIGMDGRKRLWWLPVLAMVGLAAVGYQFAKRAENQGDSYTAADAENSRLELWEAGGAMILDHPLLGIGSGHFYEFAQEYGEISHDNRGKNSHNTYLEILTGTGLIGFGSFVMMILRLIRGLRQPSSAAGPPVLNATRRATLIAIYSILFRATLDAKPHDWSFYILCTIGLACIMLQRQWERASTGQAVASDRPGSGPVSGHGVLG